MNIKMCFAIVLNIFTGFSLFAADSVLNYKVRKMMNWRYPEHSIYYVDFMPENFPINTPLKLNIKRLDGSSESFKVVVDETNKLFLADQKHKIWVDARLKGVLNGEPFEFSLLSEDRKLSASTTVIPRPIEAKDETGHTLSVRLSSQNLELFSALAEGFEPFEEVEGYSISCHEKRPFKTQASQEGKIHMALCPGVIGKSTGKASLEIKGKTTKKLKVNYQWGRKE